MEEEIRKQERERIKNIIDEEMNIEFRLKRNNPTKPKKSLRIKIDYLFERFEHLKTRVFWKIDNK